MSDTESKPVMPTLKEIESGEVQVVLPPKKPRVKIRFTSREQIIKRIDKFTAKAKRQRDEQRGLYADIGLLKTVMQNRVDVITKMSAKESQADRLGRKADRLERDVLPKLKAKLAEFQTDPLPGITDDRSVEGL
jgi:hypothetical protein